MKPVNMKLAFGVSYSAYLVLLIFIEVFFHKAVLTSSSIVLILLPGFLLSWIVSSKLSKKYDEGENNDRIFSFLLFLFGGIILLYLIRLM